MTTVATWLTTPLPTVAGSGVALDNTTGLPPLPLQALKFTQVASTACASKHTYSGTSNATAVRVYAKTPASFAASAHTIINLFDSAFTSQMARFVLAGSGTAGEVRVVNSAGTTLVASGAGIVTTNTTYRWEIWGDKTNSLVRAQVFNLGSDNPLWDSGNLTLAFASQFGACTLHNFQTTPTVGVMTYDSLVATDAFSLVGRDAADVLTTTSAVALTATITAAGTVGNIPFPTYDTVIAQYPSVLGYWECDDTSGTTLAATIGSAGAIASTGVTYSQPALITDGGKALTLDGSTGEVTIPGSSLSTFSLAFWFSTTDAAPIIFRDNSSSGGTGWFLDLTATNANVRIDGTNHTLSPAVTSASLITGARHMFGLTYDGTTATAYIDGVQKDQWVKAGGVFGAGGSIHFFRNGSLTGAANFYTGTVDQIAEFTSVLTAQDMGVIYAEGTQVYATLPLAFSVTSAGTVSGASASGDAAIAETFAATSAGTVGKVAGAAIALGFAVSASGVVGTQSGGTVSETFSATSAGQVGASATASVPLAFAVTSAGSVAGTLSSSASVPLAFSVTSSGVVGRSTATTVPLAFAATSAGTVGAPGAASVPLAFTVTSAGRVGTAATASIPLAFSVTSAGTVAAAGVSSSATVPLAFTVTTGGTVGAAASASVAPVITLTSAGFVGVRTGATVALAFAVTATGDVGGQLSPATDEHTIPARVIVHTATAQVETHTQAAQTSAHTRAAATQPHTQPVRIIRHTQEA